MRTGKFKIHYGIDINYLIDETKSREELEVFFDNKNKRWLTKTETLNELNKMKKDGFKVVPVGNCNNYDKEGRCKWHRKSN